LNEIARLTHAELGEDDKGRPVLMLSAARTKNKRAQCGATLNTCTADHRTCKKNYQYVRLRIHHQRTYSSFRIQQDEAPSRRRDLAVARAEVAKAGRHPDDLSVPNWRLHDLRRTVASGLQRLGIALPVTERVLNHVSGSFGGIVGVYQRDAFTG